MLPIGSYTGQAVNGHLGKTKAGDPQIIVKFIVVGGPHDGEQVPWAGYFTEKTFDRTIQSLRYCGWTGDDIASLDGLDTHEVEIVVEHNEYNGKVTPRVSWVNEIGGMGSMSPSEVRSFAEIVKARIARMSPAEPEPEESMPF